MENHKIPLGVKIGYGAPGLATLFTFTMFTTYGLFFFTDVVGLTATFAGFVMMIATLWDAFTDPVVGIISDKADPIKGRRRRFLLWGAIPFGITTWLLFTDFDLSDAATKVYFIIIAIVFYTAQTVIDIPYTALSGEMTSDYNERSSLSGVRIVWALLGVIFGGGLLYYISLVEPFIGSTKGAWSVVFFVFGIVCTASIFIGWRSTKGYENIEVIEVKSISFKNIIRIPFGNRPFRYVVLAFLFGIIAQAIFLGGIMYYFTYNLRLSDEQIAIVMTFMWIVGLFWVWPVSKISQIYSKKVAWNFAFGLWALSMIIFPWFINEEKSILGPLIMCSLSIAGLNALYQVVYAMIPDCVEVDELKTGERREGLYYSFATVAQKIAAALAISLLGILITTVGYLPNEIQTENTLFYLKLIFSFGTFLFCLLSMFCVQLNPLNKCKHYLLVKVLERIRRGEKVDEKEYSDLI